MSGKALALVVFFASASCREYTGVAAEVVEQVAPSAENADAKPVPTVSAQAPVSPAPPP